jgi:glycosyltransferase involved in cell wall biosynthesis
MLAKAKERRLMRVCFISHTAARNGAELALLELLKGLGKFNVHCLVFLPEKGPLLVELDRLNIEWRVVSYPRWWRSRGKSLPRRILRTLQSLAAAVRMAIILRRRRSDVVVTNTVVVSSGAFAAWLARKPHIWHLHESPYRETSTTFDLGTRWAARLVDRLSALIVVVSHSLATDYSRHIKRGKMRVVYQSVAINSEIEEKLDRKPVRGHFRCCIVGSIQPWKGQDEAIKALSEIVRRGVDAHLFIVGGENRLFTGALRELVAAYDLEQRITFTGYVNHPMQFIRMADVTLVCSRWEAFGRVIVEAMLAGKPIIAAAHSGGTAELIEEGKTGLLYERGNHIELADKIQYLYENPEVRADLGQAGYASAVGRFTQERYAREMLDLFGDVLEKRRMPAEPPM